MGKIFDFLVDLGRVSGYNEQGMFFVPLEQNLNSLCAGELENDGIKSRISSEQQAGHRQ